MLGCSQAGHAKTPQHKPPPPIIVGVCGHAGSEQLRIGTSACREQRPLTSLHASPRGSGPMDLDVMGGHRKKH